MTCTPSPAPKSSLEGSLLFWLLFKMAEKTHRKFSFTFLSAFFLIPLIETAAILTLKQMLCFALHKIVLQYTWGKNSGELYALSLFLLSNLAHQEILRIN